MFDCYSIQYLPLFNSLGPSSLTHFLQIYCIGLIRPKSHTSWAWAVIRVLTIYIFQNSTRTSKVSDRILFIHNTRTLCIITIQKSKGTIHYSWTVTITVHQTMPRQNHSVYCLLSVEKKFNQSKSNSPSVILAISWRIQGFLQLYKEPFASVFSRSSCSPPSRTQKPPLSLLCKQMAFSVYFLVYTCNTIVMAFTTVTFYLCFRPQMASVDPLSLCNL